MKNGQHHKRLAWVVSAGLAIAIIASVSPIFSSHNNDSLWHRIAGPEEDGNWKFQTIDTIDLSDQGYSLGVRWGEIVAFHNGCNSCGFSGDTPKGSSGRILTCTLVACEQRKYDALFGKFAYGSPDMEVFDERLILTLPGHRAELVRANEAT